MTWRCFWIKTDGTLTEISHKRYRQLYKTNWKRDKHNYRLVLLFSNGDVFLNYMHSKILLTHRQFTALCAIKDVKP